MHTKIQQDINILKPQYFAVALFSREWNTDYLFK